MLAPCPCRAKDVQRNWCTEAKSRGCSRLRRTKRRTLFRSQSRKENASRDFPLCPYVELPRFRGHLIPFEGRVNPFYPLDPNKPGDVRGAESLSYIVNLIVNNALVYGDIDITLDGKLDDQTTVPPEGN